MALITFIVLTGLVVLSLNIPFSQKYVTRRVNQLFVKNALPIHLGSIQRILPYQLDVRDLLISSLEGDTLIYVEEVETIFSLTGLFRARVDLDRLTLNSPQIQLSRMSEAEDMDIAAAFSPKPGSKTPPPDRKQKEWVIKIGSGHLTNLRFHLTDIPGGLNISQHLDDLRMNGFSLALSKREIELGSLNLIRSEGGIILTGGAAPEKEKTGVPWSYGFREISMQSFRYRFDHTVDSLFIDLQIDEGEILARQVDLPANLIDLDRLKLKGLSASVFSATGKDPPSPNQKPDTETIASRDASASLNGFPWDIRGNAIMLDQTVIEMGRYPAGRNDSMIVESRITDLALEVPRFRLSDSDMLFRLETMHFASDKYISLNEMSGELSSDAGSTRLEIDIETRESQLRLDGEADQFLIDLINDPGKHGRSAKVTLEAMLSPEELAAFKETLDDVSWFDAFKDRPLFLSGEFLLEGSQLEIRQIKGHQEERFEINLDGSITEPLRPDQSVVDLAMEIPKLNSTWISQLLTDEAVAEEVSARSGITLQGNVSGMYRSPAFNLSMGSDVGSLQLAGNIHIEERTYALQTQVEKLSLGELMQNEDLGFLSGSMDINGRGFNPEEFDTRLTLSIDSLMYRGYMYQAIRLNGIALQDTIRLVLNTEDPGFQSEVEADVYPFGPEIRASARGSLAATLHELDLYADSMWVESNFQAEIEQSTTHIGASLQLRNLIVEIPQETATLDSFQVDFFTDTSSTHLSAIADFLRLEAGIFAPLDSLASLGKAHRDYLVSIMDPAHDETIDRIRHLPALEINSDLTYHKAFGILLSDTTLWFSGLRFNLSNDLSNQSLQYLIEGNDLQYKGIKVKNLDASVSDSAHTLNLELAATNNMIYDTPVREIILISQLSDLESETGLSVINRFDETLYRFDLTSRVDSHLMVILAPSRQLIFNKKPWLLPAPELATVDLRSKQFYPAFELQNGSSEIKVTRTDSVTQRRFSLSMMEVDLNSLVVDSILPGHPRAIFTGELSYQSDSLQSKQINSDLQISDASWSGLDFNLIDLSGTMSSENPGHTSAHLEATLDSSDLLFNLEQRDSILQSVEARFNELPIKTFQPFLNKYLTQMRGEVSGSVAIHPAEGREQFTGGLTFQNASMRVKPLNSLFRIREDSLSFRNNRLVFNQFNVLDSLNNDLQVDGYVDFTNRQSPNAHLDITSSGIQLMNRSAEAVGPLYGNAYIDSRLTIRGPVQRPDIKGNLQLSGRSELYYRHMEDLSLSESEKIITFVSDATQPSTPPSLPGSRLRQSGRTSVETTLTIDPATRIHFNLAKRIYNIGLVIQGGGSLNYQMQGRSQVSLSGRYQINEGLANVKIVGWPNKSFRITEGGYIQWDGRVEDPELNLEAVNRVRTSYLNPVDGKQREVDFNVVLRVINRLSELVILFTVNTPDQYLMSIINTLSPEEQMRQAITVLLFENIDLPGISTNTNYMTEQVNQLLASQLNQIARTNIQGVDISFGIDSYQQATEGGGEETKTSLSYEVRKNFMDDRAQIEVSGRLNDLYRQPGASDFSLNHISFEYRLDSAGSKFLKVYNEHNYEDVFEGEVISTGIGFTYRKRYSRLGDIWRRNPGDKQKEESR